MYKALRKFPGLEESLWRICGIRLALPILMDQAAYKVNNAFVNVCYCTNYATVTRTS